MASKRKSGVDIALVLGQPAGGSPSPAGTSGPKGPTPDSVDADAEAYQAEVDTALTEAFPDLADDQRAALQRAIEAVARHGG